MKVVYNACHGGFGLSEKAIARYAEIKGLTLYPEVSMKFMPVIIYWTVPESERQHGILSAHAFSTGTLEERIESNLQYEAKRLDPRDLPRSDPALVQVVEELGEAANGKHAYLLIRDVPAGVKYRIDEYDGFEIVFTVDEYEWLEAN